MLTGTMTASIAFMPAKMMCSTTTKLSQMMRNVLMFIAANAGLVVKIASTSHWKPPVLFTQVASDIAKPSCRKAGQANVPLRSLNVHTPMPGQSIRKMVTNTM